MPILHVVKTGHKCHNPLKGKTPPASYIQMGERLQLGQWELWYAVLARAYVVCRVNLTGEHFEFTNFNCASAKLAEMGEK